MNLILRSIAFVSVTVFSALGATQVWSQPLAGGVYPSRPIRILVGFSPGSTADIMAHLAAQKMNGAVGDGG